jgi:fumarate reductase subunit C
MAPIVIAGRKVPACAITGAGFAASLVASVILFLVVKAIAS